MAPSAGTGDAPNNEVARTAGRGHRYHGPVPATLMLGASLLITIGLAIGAAASPPGHSGVGSRLLSPEGIGAVRFGQSKAQVVEALTAVLGRSAWQGPNTGCGPRYNEVEWGELVAEFRLGSFSGYRYLKGGWPLTTAGSPSGPSSSQSHGPYLATAKGISLGSTLGDVRAAYGKLSFIGVDKWRPVNGIVFVVNAEHEPEPPSSRVTEIKFGTCGDF